MVGSPRRRGEIKDKTTICSYSVHIEPESKSFLPQVLASVPPLDVYLDVAVSRTSPERIQFPIELDILC